MSISVQPTKQPIRAVIFDFDGTIRHNDPSAHTFFFDHAVSLGAAESPENRRNALRWAHKYWNSKGGVIPDTEKYGEDTDDFWLNYHRQYLRAFNCPGEQADDLAPLMTKHMAESYEPGHRIEDDTIAFLESLRRAGLVLGVVSNRNRPFTDLMDLLDLTPHFDFTLAAGEVNSWKPDPEIFHHGVGMSGVRPEEALYVGDNYYADIIGSQRAGLHPVLFDPEDIFPDAACPVIGALPELASLVHNPLSLA